MRGRDVARKQDRRRLFAVVDISSVGLAVNYAFNGHFVDLEGPDADMVLHVIFFVCVKQSSLDMVGQCPVAPKAVAGFRRIPFRDDFQTASVGVRRPEAK